MKKRFTTLLLCTIFAAGALAQKPTAVIYEASVAPIIDGEYDDVWDEAPQNPLERNVINEEPSLGAPGETYWQGLWTDEGIYVLLTVADDVFFPYYLVGLGEQTWQYDKTELYFDVNAFDLEDGGGPLPDWVGGGNGHYQIDIPFAEGLNDGTPQNNPRAGLENVQVAFMVYDPNYIAEYFVPFSTLINGDGGPIDLTSPVGFDVYIIDRDNAEGTWGNLVWANTGGTDGSTTSWNNMDDCGEITFDGAEAPVYIDDISLTGGEITENNGTLQLVPVLDPPEANEGIVWSLENGDDGGRAKINKSNGMVTALLDGTVTVTCKSASGYASAEAEVTISGQVVSLKDVNVIRNPDFDRVDANFRPQEWGGGAQEGSAGAPLPTVVDGEVVCAPIESTEGWHYQLDQMNLTALPNIDYMFSFVGRADDDREINVVFEDAAAGDHQWNNYGASSDATSTGRSNWTLDLTAESQRFDLNVNFDEIYPTTIQRLTFQLGLSGVTLYLDSFYLVSVDDYALIEDYIEVSWIDVSGEGGATTVAQGGTLQMQADVSPEDADYPAVKWSVEPETGWATIDENGLLTGDSSGTVKVIASATDDSGVWGWKEIKVSWPEGISDPHVSPLKVYPNPAVNELTVELTLGNALVSIFNSVGQKMDEVLVTGTRHQFDISRYASGIYYVKTGNTVAKFIK